MKNLHNAFRQRQFDTDRVCCDIAVLKNLTIELFWEM